MRIDFRADPGVIYMGIKHLHIRAQNMVRMHWTASAVASVLNQTGDVVEYSRIVGLIQA